MRVQPIDSNAQRFLRNIDVTAEAWVSVAYYIPNDRKGACDRPGLAANAGAGTAATNALNGFYDREGQGGLLDEPLFNTGVRSDRGQPVAAEIDRAGGQPVRGSTRLCGASVPGQSLA